MLDEPFLRNFSPLLKIIFFGLIVVATLLFTLLFGMLLAYVIFGPDVLAQMMDMTGDAILENVALQKYVQIISQFGTFIFPVLIFAFLAGRNIAAYLKLGIPPRSTTLILAFAAFVALLPFINWLMLVNEQVHLPGFLSGLEEWMRASEEQAQRIMDAFLGDSSFKGLLINIFMIGVLAAVGEELVFRGVGIRLLDEWMHNKHLAIWISAIAFSTLHLQFYGFLPRMVLGVVLGYLFVWTGSLWVPIITHFLNNGLAVVLIYLYNRGYIASDPEEFGSTGEWALILLSVVLFTGLMGVIYWQENKKRRLPESISFSESDRK
jgi:hypothetical protein